MTLGFSEWLRGNSEHYLLEAAQRDAARRYGLREPRSGGGPMAFLWRRIFVPVYRILPWSVRRWTMHLMPGSHRRRWEERAPPEPPRAALPARRES
jgi:hypothetical protein